MDENTWRFSQIIMWLIGIQTTVIMAAFAGMWTSITKRFDELDKRLDKIDEKITDIDRRVCRIEGALQNKDCCLLKDSRNKGKAE